MTDEDLILQRRPDTPTRSEIDLCGAEAQLGRWFRQAHERIGELEAYVEGYRFTGTADAEWLRRAVRQGLARGDAGPGRGAAPAARQRFQRSRSEECGVMVSMPDQVAALAAIVRKARADHNTAIDVLDHATLEEKRLNKEVLQAEEALSRAMERWLDSEEASE